MREMAEESSILGKRRQQYFQRDGIVFINVVGQKDICKLFLSDMLFQSILINKLIKQARCRHCVQFRYFNKTKFVVSVLLAAHKVSIVEHYMFTR